MAARQGGCRELHTCTMATINDRRQRMKPPKGNDHARGSNPSRAIEVCPHTLGPPQAMKKLCRWSVVLRDVRGVKAAWLLQAQGGQRQSWRWRWVRQRRGRGRVAGSYGSGALSLCAVWRVTGRVTCSA